MIKRIFFFLSLLFIAFVMYRIVDEPGSNRLVTYIQSFQPRKSQISPRSPVNNEVIVNVIDDDTIQGPNQDNNTLVVVVDTADTSGKILETTLKTTNDKKEPLIYDTGLSKAGTPIDLDEKIDENNSNVAIQQDLDIKGLDKDKANSALGSLAISPTDISQQTQDNTIQDKTLSPLPETVTYEPTKTVPIQNQHTVSSTNTTTSYPRQNDAQILEQFMMNIE